MNTSFTPGPWKWKNQSNGSADLFAEDGAKVILCNARLINKEANAQLIASAPELLEQCIILCDAITQFSSGDEWPELKPAWSIISKATGQTP